MLDSGRVMEEIRWPSSGARTEGAGRRSFRSVSIHTAFRWTGRKARMGDSEAR